MRAVDLEFERIRFVGQGADASLGGERVGIRIDRLFSDRNEATVSD